MDFERFLLMENATNKGRQEMLRLGIAVMFLVGIIIFLTMGGGEVSYSLVVAAIIGGYMALNIGAKPTFEDYSSTFEVFLLDYSGDLRGKKINVLFVEKLRDIVKFDGPESLKRQIAADVEKTRQILKQEK